MRYINAEISSGLVEFFIPQKLCIAGSARGELERRKLQSWGDMVARAALELRAALEQCGRRL